MTARGSIAAPIRRLLTRSIATTWAADRNAARTAASSPRAQRKQTLPGAQACSCGAASACAARASVTAGRGARGRCVDPANGRVRVRGANERAGERAGELDVGHEPPVAGEKALILDASQRSADALIVPHARTRHVDP